MRILVLQPDPWRLIMATAGDSWTIRKNVQERGTSSELGIY